MFNLFAGLFGKKDEDKKPVLPTQQPQNNGAVSLPAAQNRVSNANGAISIPGAQPKQQSSLNNVLQNTNQFRMVQRPDKGFDFYNGANKTNVDDYVKNTGANKQSLVQDMANKGDAVSQSWIKNQIALRTNANSLTQPNVPKLTSPVTQNPTPVLPHQYSMTQRPDKGFDFARNGQKIDVNEYVRGTGANKDILVADMANKGDVVSQRYQQARQANQAYQRSQPNIVTQIGKGVASGIQQGAGSVADTVIQGGGLLDELSNQLHGGTEAEKALRRSQNIARSEALRSTLHDFKDVSGNNIVGTSDVDQNASRIAAGNGDLRDYMAVGGKGLDVGLSATMFTNPARVVGDAAKGMTGKELAKFAARDAGFYGAGDALATGAQVYGQTGDVGEALKQGAIAGGVSALSQGALDAAGYGVGRTVKSVRNVNQVQQDITEALKNPQSKIDVNTIRDVAKNSPSLTARVAANRVLKERVDSLNERILSSGPVNYLFGDTTPVQNATMRRKFAEAIDAGEVAEPIAFGNLTPEHQARTNEILAGVGVDPIVDPQLLVHPNVIKKLSEKRVRDEGMTSRQVARTAFDAVHNPDAILDATDKSQSARFVHNKNNLQDNAFVGQSGGSASLKSVYPTENQNLVSGIQRKPDPRSASSDPRAGATDMQLASSVSDAATKPNIARNDGNVNELNRPEVHYINEQVASHNTPQEFRNSIVERIWENNKKAAGVDSVLIDGPDGTVRRNFSNNSPFYQAYYKENGRKPTKRAIEEMVDEELAGKPTILSDTGEMTIYDETIARQIADRNEANSSLSSSHRIEDQAHNANRISAPRQVQTLQSKKNQVDSRSELPVSSALHNEYHQQTLNNKHSDLVKSTPSSKQPKLKEKLPRELDDSSPSNASSLDASSSIPQDARQPYRQTIELPQEQQRELIARQSPKESSSDQNQPFQRNPHEIAPSHTRKSESLDKQDASTYTDTTKDTDIKQYVKDQVKLQAFKAKTPVGEKVGDFFARAKNILIDDAVAYERYIKDKDVRSIIRESVDRVRGSDLIATQFAKDNGIDTIVKVKGKDYPEFQQYLIAKRAIEIEKQGKNSGRNLDLDRALIKKVGDKYALQEKAVREYSKAMLDYSVEGGLITKELRDSLVKESPDYVPMNRIIEDIENQGLHQSRQLGSLSKQSVVQKLKGSDKTVQDPIASMVFNTYRMINEVERNKTAKLLAGNLSERFIKEGEKVRPGYDKLSYLDNGAKVSIEVPDLVAREMRNLNGVVPGWLNATIKVVGTPTRMLRAGATGVNPIFTATNLVRDQIQAAMIGDVVASAKGTPKAFAAVFDPSPYGKKLRAELRRNGIIGSEYRQTYGYDAKKLARELQRSASPTKSVLHRLVPTEWINTIADIIGTTESFTRAQQYFGTKGTNTVKAQAARNNTLNFSRGGLLVRELNKVIPFLNAAVQGGRTTVVAFHKKPIQTSAAFAAITSVALGARYLNETQNKELYERLSDEEKNQNLIFFKPGSKYNPDTNRIDGIVKIPMPQMTYPFLSAVNSVDEKPESYMALASSMQQAVTGIDLSGLFKADVKDMDISPTMNQLTPTFMKPAIEIGLNKSLYTGQEIISEYDKNESAQDQGKKYSSGLARTIAEKTNVPAPWIDNIIGNITGSAGKDLVKATTDNPDNSSDGGGYGEIFAKGLERRFSSANVTSQYDIQKEVAKGYQELVKNDSSFKSLSREDQVKVLDKIDADTQAIAGFKAKTEQGRQDEIKKDLSKRQQSLVESGFDASKYVKSAMETNSGRGVEIAKGLDASYKSTLDKYNDMDTDERKNWFNTDNAAEYTYLKAKHENSLADRSYSTAERIRAEKDLQKAKVGSDYSKNTRELYGLSKAQLADYLTTAENGVKKKEMFEELQRYDNALYDAGLIKTKKFKYGLSTAKSGSSALKKIKLDLAAVGAATSATTELTKKLAEIQARASKRTGTGKITYKKRA